MLRHCLQWIENPQAQAHATLFVAKFFGRAALMSFLSSVPANQRSGMQCNPIYACMKNSYQGIYGINGDT